MSEMWLGVADVAKHVGVSKETIYRWVEGRKCGCGVRGCVVCRAEIPCVRVGKLWKFSVSKVDEWMMLKREPKVLPKAKVVKKSIKAKAKKVKEVKTTKPKTKTKVVGKAKAVVKKRGVSKK